jgi:D-alanyl-lipoteichoic acid acyltransferase DltB (MBOAT superfamily)
MHILAGIVCLIAGFLAIKSKKKKGNHTRAGEIYHFSYIVIFITSIVMAIWNWNESAYLFYIALFSYGLALYGYLARKMKWKKWLLSHIAGMLGSYIGVITAVLVVNQPKIPIIQDFPSLLVWFLPTIIGTPLIKKVSDKYKPKTKTGASDIIPFE